MCRHAFFFFFFLVAIMFPAIPRMPAGQADRGGPVHVARHCSHTPTLQTHKHLVSLALLLLVTANLEVLAALQSVRRECQQRVRVPQLQSVLQRSSSQIELPGMVLPSTAQTILMRCAQMLAQAEAEPFTTVSCQLHGHVAGTQLSLFIVRCMQVRGTHTLSACMWLALHLLHVSRSTTFFVVFACTTYTFCQRQKKSDSALNTC